MSLLRFASPVLLLMVLAPAAAAQNAVQDAALRRHVDAVLTARACTPDGAGLLPTALAEAQILGVEAQAAARAPDLAARQAHARGVLHAIDPALVREGPGRGYGVRPALAAIVPEIEALMAADALPDVALLGRRAFDTARQVQGWTETLAAAAQRLLAARSDAESAAAAAALPALAAQLARGVDRDGDRQVTFGPGEAGLLHLRLTLRALVDSRTARATLPAEVSR